MDLDIYTDKLKGSEVKMEFKCSNAFCMKVNTYYGFLSSLKNLRCYMLLTCVILYIRYCLKSIVSFDLIQLVTKLKFRASLKIFTDLSQN